mgnify:CR=1 FL=1|jgi:hypothetical protein
MITCGNYNEEFICDLLKQVDNKIALVTNKDYKNSVYNLGLKSKAINHGDLIDIHNILNKILKCHSCYEDIDIEDVVSMVKNKLNKC